MGLNLNLNFTSLFRRGQVNPSTPTFGNINLTEKITNLNVNTKFSQQWL